MGDWACEILRGAEKIPIERAYQFAFEKFNKDIIIDNSRDLTWVQKFRDTNEFEVKFIHLIRDPRGYVCSELKHHETPYSVEHHLQQWLKTNSEIKNFIKGKDGTTVFYDQLASGDIMKFKDLFAKLNLSFEEPALRYWEYEHHGPGGNGAASLFMGKLPQRTYVTSDDNYYKKRGQTNFLDDRWKTDLTTEQLDLIVNYPEVKNFLKVI